MAVPAEVELAISPDYNIRRRPLSALILNRASQLSLNWSIENPAVTNPSSAGDLFTASSNFSNIKPEPAEMRFFVWTCPEAVQKNTEGACRELWGCAMMRAFSDLLEWASAFDDARYSIDSLAASLFVNSPNPRARLMAMFTAYFDASGNAEQNHSFIVVSGYIANMLQWRSLEVMWEYIHKEAGVNKPFHMSEFVAATSNPDRYAKQKNARADYVAIGKDLPKAEKFLRDICLAQQTIVNCGISCIVDLKIYNEIGSLLDLRRVIPPYALAARMCVAKVHDWEDQFAVQEPTEIIFEKGDLEQEKFTELVKDEGGPPPIYRDKKDYAGLQAADHYAWEQFFYLKKQRTGAHLPARGAFKFLLNFIPCMHIQVHRDGLLKLCERKNIDPRTGVKHDKEK
jgi:hypothetical protein